MLCREALLALGPPAEPFLSELSRRHRADLGPQVLGAYALYRAFGADALLAAMALAHGAGSYSAEALGLLLAPPAPGPAVPPLALAGVPTQAEVDRPLSAYEDFVTVDAIAEPPAAEGAPR